MFECKAHQQRPMVRLFAITSFDRSWWRTFSSPMKCGDHDAAHPLGTILSGQGPVAQG
jgi:hypothetical protein